MGGPAEALAALVASRSWSALIKDLDARIAASEAPHIRLLLNRGFLLQQIGLYRKALKASRPPGSPDRCTARPLPPPLPPAAACRPGRSLALPCAGL